MSTKLFLVLFVNCAIYQIAFSYRILGIFPIPSKSHYYIGQTLMQGLAEHGHDVTIISPFKEKTPIANYTEIFIENSYDLWVKATSADNFLNYSQLNFWDMTIEGFTFGNEITRWTFESENLQKFLNAKQHFDVIVIETGLESLYGFHPHFNAPLIGISAFGASKLSADLVGTPEFSSYTPHFKSYYSDRMTFWQRFRNSLLYLTQNILYPINVLPFQQEMMEKHFPNAKNWPSLMEIKKNFSLVLLNTHVTYGTARPYAPNMIEVGGMQIKRSIEPLSKNIQRFLDKAKDGAIYVSLGSNVRLDKLLPQQLDALRNAFIDYPNVRILIKSEKKVSIPSHKKVDILIEPWFDQHSILAHPNVRLFVTHGGLLSITESIHFGKPMVGIPVMFDQYMNMEIAEQKGYGISVPIGELTAKKLKTAVGKVLDNPSYDKQAKLTSDRYHDLLNNPLETGIYWVEHVAKNKGAPHLRSVAVDLTFYQLYNLDCWSVVIIGLLFTIFIVFKLFGTVIWYFFSNSKVIIKAKEA